MRKAEIWISVVIYVLIVIVIMVIVLEAGIPKLNNLRDKSTLSRVKDTMAAIDQHIVDIANEGQGSQRVVPIDVPKGTVDVQDNKLRWKVETDSKIVEPRTRTDQGNLIVATSLDVTVKEFPDSYTMENSKILINLTKYGSQDNWTSINTSSLVNYVQSKKEGSQTIGVFKFLLQNNESSGVGTGYTKPVEKGSSLTTGIITAHVNTTSYEYNLKISLDSDADFFRASIADFRTK